MNTFLNANNFRNKDLRDLIPRKSDHHVLLITSSGTRPYQISVFRTLAFKKGRSRHGWHMLEYIFQQESITSGGRVTNPVLIIQPLTSHPLYKIKRRRLTLSAGVNFLSASIFFFSPALGFRFTVGGFHGHTFLNRKQLLETKI